MEKVFEGQGVDVRNSDWQYSKTPLMLVPERDGLEYCQTLLERGADINARDLQGYTALHHALFKCNFGYARLLVKMGADTSLKSESGRVCYDLIPSNRLYTSFFTDGAWPAKEAEIYEKAGAVIMFQFANLKRGFRLWTRAMDVYKKFNLEPSPEFIADYDFLRENKNAFDEIGDIHTVLNTVTRFSGDERTKFWNFLRPYVIRGRPRSNCFYVLDLLSQEFKRVEEFASLEEVDFLSLLELVKIFECWFERPENDSAIPERVSQLHSVSKLVISCFNKLMQGTKCNRVSDTCMEVYVRLCGTLTLLHFWFDEVIWEEALNENERLLRTLVGLDLREGESYNSLAHIIFVETTWTIGRLQFYIVSLDFVDVTTRNELGFEPVQLIDWDRYEPLGEDLLEALVKMADRGAHVDAASSLRHFSLQPPSTLREVFQKVDDKENLAFRYDNLQCTCARILATSTIPYLNRVPKRMVEFINSHKPLIT